MKKELDRRSFVKLLATSAVALPLLKVGNLFAGPKPAGLPPKGVAMDENATLPKIYGYKHDAKNVDTAKYKKFVAGQSCSNCAQYIQKNDGWGECKIIKGGLVAKDGWCSSYLKKA